MQGPFLIFGTTCYLINLRLQNRFLYPGVKCVRLLCMHGKVLCVLASVFFLFNTVNAQVASTAGLQRIAAAADSFAGRSAFEKIYLQLDKPNYTVGDTIWFKAYLLKATYLTPVQKSGLLYVELTSDSGKMVQRIMLPLLNGLSWGNIFLSDKVYGEGGYTLRAYTNWMRNFGNAYIFEQHIYIANPAANNWTVSTRLNIDRQGSKETAKVALRFSQLNNEPAILKDLKLNVYNGKQQLYSGKASTKLDGSVELDLPLKTPVKKLVVEAQRLNDADASRMIIPVAINRAEDIDVQFMPEGGRMVAGLPAEIGFKAIGEDGHAADVAGEVFDSRGQQVAVFKSAHKGMGVFTLMPEAGVSYMAKVSLPGGGSKNYNLPPAESAGTILHINTVRGADSIAVTVAAVNARSNYYLIAHANGIVCYAAMVNLDNNAVKSKISIAKFPTGIVRFTLLNAAQQPLNERLTFIDHHDYLKMNMIADKEAYNARDSVGLQLTVTDHSGRPVEGNFSLAVTDDSQVKKDSLTNTIVSNLLLTSNLKGEVEEPGYYFQLTGDSTIIKQDLDNLLLTQGWVGYDWKDVFAPAREPVFPAEKEFVITGRVTNAFNKPLAGTHVQLLSKKPFTALDSVTHKDGRFIFRNIMPVDTPSFIMQARNRHGRSFNVSLSVDEFKEPLFPLPAAPSIPWYVNPEGNTIDNIKQDIAAKVARDNFKGSGKLLKEVKIISKKYIKDSQNPNGPGNADIAIDEKELEKAGKKNVLQLLQERVPGFREGVFVLVGSEFSQKVKIDRALFKFVTDSYETKAPESNMAWYFANGNAVKFIIDGVPLFKVYTTDNTSAFRDLNSYLTTTSAEDIKGLEVSMKSRYTLKYQQEDTSYVAFGHTAFIELTTRSGKGPLMPYTPGTYLYKPMPFSFPASFYRPKYTAKKADSAARDDRSTIYWNPAIVTDKQGKANTSFYTSDRPGPFTLVLEGADGSGNIGSYRFKLNAKKK